MSRKAVNIIRKMFTLSQKLFVTKRNKLTGSNVTINVFTMVLFRQNSSGSQKGIRFSYVTKILEVQRNKVLSQLSGVPVKTCLPSTRAAYSKSCPIKDPILLKQLQKRGAGREHRLQFECL